MKFTQDSAPRQWRVASAALFNAGVSKKNITKVKEVISGSVPICQRVKFLKLLDSATDIYVESARAISRKASQGEELYNIAKEKGVSIICSDFPKLFALQPSPIESFMRKLVLAMQELDKGKDTIRVPKGQWSQVYFTVAEAKFIQSEKMISLSKKRSKGCFGWRSLATKFDAILKIKGGKKLSVETVRRMVRELGSR